QVEKRGAGVVEREGMSVHRGVLSAAQRDTGSLHAPAGPAIGLAGVDPCAEEQERCLREVVLAMLAIERGEAPDLAAHDHQRLVRERAAPAAAAAQLGEEAGDQLDGARGGGLSLGVEGVRVPGLLDAADVQLEAAGEV